MQRQVALLQEALETPQERSDVFVIGIVVENLKREPLERVIIDNGQNAKRAVVQFVDGHVAGEISQGPIEIGVVDLARRLFSPRPPPSFGWWRRERKRGDRATGANWRLDKVSRPRPQVARP